VSIGAYLDLLARAEAELADSLARLSENRSDEGDVRSTAQVLATQARARSDDVAAQVEERGVASAADAAGLPLPPRSAQIPSGSVGLLRELQSVQLAASFAHTCWVAVGQAAKAARDQSLAALADDGGAGVQTALSWLETRLKESAAQALSA
jgi:hypothetical protein